MNLFMAVIYDVTYFYWFDEVYVVRICSVVKETKPTWCVYT